jgi:predicted DNA-binding transcriptional regulator YafY
MNKIERLTSEILLLQERKRSSEELAELLEVSKRTIIRDIQVLCEMGVPVIARDGLGGGYWLPSEYTVQPLQLTWKEMLLLMLALDGLSKISDTPFAAERNSLIAKVQSQLPVQHRERVGNLLGKVSMDMPDRELRSPMLESLVELLEQGKWARLTYRSGGPAYSVDVKPLRVVVDRGLWYLRAAVEGKEKTYRVDRIERVEIGEPVTTALEPLPYDHPSHPSIRVRLGQRGLNRMDSDQHLFPLVRGLEAPATIEFRCPPDELDWYASLFGELLEEAVVESPPQLIERILERANRLETIYKAV